MINLLIDQREPKYIIDAITNKYPNSITSLLDSGDVWIACDKDLLIIERKTPDDLLSSIKDNRLFEQVTRMLQQSKWCYVVITGMIYPGSDGKVSTGDRQTGWNFDSVQGALLSIQELGCSIVYTKNEFDYVDCLSRLIARDRNVLRVGAQRQSNILSPAEQVLMAIPYIGYERAQKLLEFRPRLIDAIAELTRADLQTIPGISTALKNKIKTEVFGMELNEIVIVGGELDLDFIKA